MARTAAAARQARPAVARKPSPTARAAAARLTAPEPRRKTAAARTTRPAAPRAHRSTRSAKQARRSTQRLLPRGLGLRIPRLALARSAAPATAASAATPGTAVLPALGAPLARGARAGGGRLLDALPSGRGWIALVFVLLAGIVFFNVDLLQLNREIAVGTERAAELKQRNASLRLKLAELGSSKRVQTEAAEAGFVLPAPGDVRYVRAATKDARRAMKLIEAPSPVEPIAPVVTPTTPDPLADPAAPVSADPATDPAAVAPPATPDPTTGAVPTTAAPPAAG